MPIFEGLQNTSVMCRSRSNDVQMENLMRRAEDVKLATIQPLRKAVRATRTMAESVVAVAELGLNGQLTKSAPQQGTVRPKARDIRSPYHAPD